MRSYVRASDVMPFADLVAVRAGDVTALTSEYPSAPAADEAELRAHDAITRRVHDAMPSLPARFGAFFDDPETLRRALASRDASLRTALDEVGTRIELGITLRWRSSRAIEPRRDGSGRAYLESIAARQQERSEAEQIVGRLIAMLTDERALIRESICPHEGIAATVAVLTTRDGEMYVRERTMGFGRDASSVTIEVYGPFPPYSFVS